MALTETTQLIEVTVKLLENKIRCVYQTNILRDGNIVVSNMQDMTYTPETRLDFLEDIPDAVHYMAVLDWPVL